MSPEMKLEKGLKSDLASKLAAREMASSRDLPADSAAPIPPAGDAVSNAKGEVTAAFSSKGEVNKVSTGENGFYSVPTSGYNYYYPGYGGSFTQLDDLAYFQADTGLQTENGSMLYYVPGYGPYASGPVVGINGQGVNQQPYLSSTGYLPPVSYGSEAMPYYSFDPTYFGDIANGNSGHVAAKNRSGSTFSKLNGSSHVNSNGHTGNKFYKPTYAQPTKTINKVSPVDSEITTSLLKGYQPGGKFSYAGHKHGQFLYNVPMDYRQNGRLWNGNDRYKSRDRFSKNGDYETSPELTCGPRAAKKDGPTDDATKKEDSEATISVEQYNLPDFETKFTNAKFYVIKSYNEDDIHKSIKYNVWASTPNGNKKLDAAYQEAEQKSNESGAKCPIFLFFSVNGSGQFVGVAEMVGKVDFDKNMDFWQLDKWNGFFPLKWHIVKDVPNSQLRHIILENNEGRAVTYSRDTQEIGLKQGMEMLKIFKSYSSLKSLLDDFNFYENREKSLHAKKNNKPATLRMETYQNGDIRKLTNGERNFIDESRTKILANPTSLISLTKNLSLNGCSPKTNPVKKPTENSIPAVVPSS